jgi:outer membrane protein
MTANLFKTATLAAALAATLAAPLAANAQAQQGVEGPWLVRVRAVGLNSDNRDSTGLKLAINDRVIPEVDVSYFFTPEWATELVLTYPQKHDITAAGTKIGTLKHLPPTLTAQYHYNALGAFRPYLGAGVNYTRFSGVSFSPAVTAALQPSLSKDSFGLALQVGFDYQVAKNVYLNMDLKKVQIQTDVKSFGAKVGELKVDPVLFGVGLGYRF